MKHGIDYFTHNARSFEQRVTAEGLIDVYPHELLDLKARLASTSTFPSAEGIDVTEHQPAKQG